MTLLLRKFKKDFRQNILLAKSFITLPHLRYAAEISEECRNMIPF